MSRSTLHSTTPGLARFQLDLIRRIGEQRTTRVIDVAALDLVDSFTGHILAGCATMARLRGVQLTVVGLQPDVAITMVERGLTADPAHTALNLQDGMDQAAHLPPPQPSRRPTSRRVRSISAGLNGAGKTTHARHLAATLPAVRFRLDEWPQLYDLSFDDEWYPSRAERCRALIWDLTAQIVRAGTSVVLDWNMWSRSRRADAVKRAADLDATCHLHHVVVRLDVAIQRATSRRHPWAHRLDADAVRHLAALFEPPETAEGSSCISWRTARSIGKPNRPVVAEGSATACVSHDSVGYCVRPGSAGRLLRASRTTVAQRAQHDGRRGARSYWILSWRRS